MALRMPPAFCVAGDGRQSTPGPAPQRQRLALAGKSHVAVVRETERLLLVNKPPGMSFHADQADELGLVETLRAMQQSQQLEYNGGLFSVHRLDRVTSGVILFAKDAEAAAMAAAAFQNRTVHKYYISLGARKPSKTQGRVVGDMARSRRSAWMLKRATTDPAVTYFNSWGCPGSRPGLRMFILKPETGKTHQLRVAMKALGSPILGDPLYGSGAEADRCYLHAAGLRLPALGGGLEGLDVVVPPAEGDEFVTPEFQAAFDQHFLANTGDDAGVWFSDTKLLRSHPLHDGPPS
mmetsp:Transcript_44785/g.113357  ORF Transcript_44785/g.113357 Transcript_44785/m.113357 type:complete len:293 (-) Transcript_44785:21-899(-)